MRPCIAKQTHIQQFLQPVLINKQIWCHFMISTFSVAVWRLKAIMISSYSTTDELSKHCSYSLNAVYPFISKLLFIHCNSARTNIINMSFILLILNLMICHCNVALNLHNLSIKSCFISIWHDYDQIVASIGIKSCK